MDRSLYDWTKAAEYLGTSERHLKRLWAERRIGGSKVGRFVRFSQRDLDLYIDQNHMEALR